MYEFVDTNQAGSKNSLPSEALQIDGEYIENLIVNQIQLLKPQTQL